MALQFGSTSYRAPRVPVRYPIPTIVSGTTPFQQRATPASSAAPVSQTLAQVANQRVNQQLAPQIAAQNAFNQRQNQVIQSFAEALLGKLQPQAGEVGQAYDSAIQQTGALSGAAANYLNAQNPSGKVAELLQSINAPESQQQQLAANLGQTFGGGAGVLQFVGGAIPGGQLAADKAAAVGQAAQLPGLAALKGQQDLASALWQQGQDRRTLLATRPGLYQAAAQDIRQNNAARQKAAYTARQDQIANQFKAASLNQRASQFQQSRADKAADRALKAKAADFLNWYRTQGINLSEQKINDAASRFGITAQQAQQRIAVSQQNANTSASRAASSAAATQARLAQSDARLKLAQRHEKAYEQSKAASTAAKRKGISATSYANLRKQALAKADLFYYGKQPTNQAQTNGIPGINYGQALKQLMDGYSLSREDATAILNDFYAPGERGRPANPPSAKGAAAYYGRNAPKHPASAEAKVQAGRKRAADVLKQAGL